MDSALAFLRLHPLRQRGQCQYLLTVTSMKMMDTTIKGIKESEEYKIAQAYNQGLRDAMVIFEREMKQ